MMEGSGASCKDFIGQAIKEGKTIAMANHMMLIRKDGSSVPVADSAAPFFDAQQKIGGCVVIFRDVTREREVDRAKTEFVSLASHQLRTPLTSIDWISEMLLNKNFGEITDKQKESIEMLHRSSRRMVSLIGALLNVSRLELGTFAINPTPVKLSRVADETLQELDRQIRQKELTIVKQYPVEESPIRVDAIFIKIIWQNLLTNAVKYAFPKTALTVSLEKNDHSYVFAVKNVGIGIPQEEQPHIFSKLFRASNAQSMDTDGTGLGLYMVKTILDESGGKIWFDSTVEGETNFFVELPLSGMEVRTGNKSLEIV